MTENIVTITDHRDALFDGKWNLGNGAHIETVGGTAHITAMAGNARIATIGGQARIDEMRDTASIDVVCDEAHIGKVCDAARIRSLYNQASIGTLGDESHIAPYGTRTERLAWCRHTKSNSPRQGQENEMITAFFGDAELKQMILDSMKEDQRLDAFIQQAYTAKRNGTFKGCNLGCLTRSDSDPHRMTKQLFGFPLKIAYWIESIFDALPINKAAQWAIDSLEAIPIGADLSTVHYRLAYWLLGPESPSADGNTHELVADAVATVRELCHLASNGVSIGSDDWLVAELAVELAARAARATRSAAESAAESAAWSASWSAWSDARSVARSVKTAAWSAAWSAWSDARSAAWESIANQSLWIFRTAPISKCELCMDRVAAAKEHISAYHLVY